MLDVPPVRLRFFQKAGHQDLAISHPAEMLTLDMVFTGANISCALVPPKMLDVPPVRLRFLQRAAQRNSGTSHPAEPLT
jgi:hypothetical protein